MSVKSLIDTELHPNDLVLQVWRWSSHSTTKRLSIVCTERSPDSDIQWFAILQTQQTVSLYYLSDNPRFYRMVLEMLSLSMIVDSEWLWCSRWMISLSWVVSLLVFKWWFRISSDKHRFHSMVLLTIHWLLKYHHMTEWLGHSRWVVSLSVFKWRFWISSDKPKFHSMVLLTIQWLLKYTL